MNWKEIELVLSELPLEGSRIISISQNSFHSLTWVLFHPSIGRWALFTETQSPEIRIHKTSLSKAKDKLPKLQRFIQFTRKNLEGGKIIKVEQASCDRLVVLTVSYHSNILKIFMRFYSGPAANIIITDDNNKILELLNRRPNRGESAGNTFVLPKDNPSPLTDKFKIRERIGDNFNEQLDNQFNTSSLEEKIEKLKKRVLELKIKTIQKQTNRINSLEKNITENKDYDSLKEIGDLLSSNFYLLKPNSSSINLKDFSSEEIKTINLKKNLSPSQNINYYYDKAKKSKRTFFNATETLNKTIIEKEKKEKYFNNLLNDKEDLEIYVAKLENALKNEKSEHQTEVNTIGLSCNSHGFTILIGRTAKENDFLLRHKTRGNDYWFHTRDYPGGYIFIKNIRNKSIPLATILDAANLAVLFSKAKNSSKIDLYYTQVKYLRRAKNGPLGLVLPTNEKNLCINFDKQRAQELLNDKNLS